MVLPDKRCVNFYTSILQLCYERVVGITNKTSLIGLYAPRKLLIRYLYVIWVEWMGHYKTVRAVNLTEVSGSGFFGFDHCKEVDLGLGRLRVTLRRWELLNADAGGK